jgi:hypothetical protein
MLDGAELAQAIAAHPDDLEAAGQVRAGHVPARRRNRRRNVYDLMLGDDAPHSWIAMMTGDEQAS